jgi:type II secretory pathway component PulF
LVEDHDDTSNRNHASLRQTAFYTIIMLVILAVSLSFLMIYIIPTFVQISEELWLQEVDVARPWPFQTLVAIWNNLSRYAPLWILAVILVAWSIWSLPSRRFFRRLVSARWAGSVAQARSAELLRLLAIAVEAGRPVPAAISSLARYHFDKSVRDKLLFARNEMEQGADVWQSLADAQLITPQESNALAQASSARSRVWMMRRLALWKQDTIARRNETVVAFAQPLVTLIFAGVVLLIGTAIFGVLSRLIQVLA